MGRRLGKYELIGEIARGGMGIVHLAFAHGPANFGKLLVIKELKAEYVGDPTFRDMFLEEARLAARLNHPNIVQTYDVGSHGLSHFLVMDYLDGVTLGKVLRQRSPRFTRSMHLRVLCDILQGLEYAHTLRDFDGTELRIVHRDVNPSNVFITFDGQVKLVDFGIAKTLDSKIQTGNGILKGKAAYMAPEQVAGVVDGRADVYSAGVMLWEAIAERRMWTGKTDVEVLVHVVREQLPRLRDVVPNVPEPLARVVDKALAKNPDDRFSSAAALQDALEHVLEGDPEATNRALRRTLGDLFAAERTARQRAIKEEMAELRASSRSSSYPTIESAASLMPMQIGPTAPPFATPSVPIQALGPLSPLAPAGASPTKPLSVVLRGAAVVAVAALSFFVGLRTKQWAPARASASRTAPPPAADIAETLMPLEAPLPAIEPAPTLEPPLPSPSASAAGARPPIPRTSRAWPSP